MFYQGVGFFFFSVMNLSSSIIVLITVCALSFLLLGLSMKTLLPWKIFMKAQITSTWSCNCKYPACLMSIEGYGPQNLTKECCGLCEARRYDSDVCGAPRAKMAPTWGTQSSSGLSGPMLDLLNPQVGLHATIVLCLSDCLMCQGQMVPKDTSVGLG
jgi:hypothetical protein